METTIAAVSTPPGIGGIAVIRVSGPEAIDHVARLFVSRRQGHDITSRPSHTLTLGTIERDGVVLDDVVASLYRAPHSYTGEDVVELSCHGSEYVQRTLLSWLVDVGCVVAGPGEFTRRAYMNGRMDLSQAEAVADVIASGNEASHRAALSQMRGSISTELSMLRDQLLHLTALVELELDFSDHEDLEFVDRSELLELARRVDSRVLNLMQSFQTGQAIKRGVPVAIVGRTNVGKSTLLNRLLHEERAIVSDVHGTTRDTIEDTVDIRGVAFRFIDTAGIRATVDSVEQIGIGRTYQAIDKARLVVWVVDSASDMSPDDTQEIASRVAGKSVIVVQNKIDLLPGLDVGGPDASVDGAPTAAQLPFEHSSIAISAKTGQNIERLEQLIYDAAGLSSLSDSDVVITSARHYASLSNAHRNLERVVVGLEQQHSTDLVAEDLRLVISDLADITGQGVITPQETLNLIFREFCIGK